MKKYLIAFFIFFSIFVLTSCNGEKLTVKFETNGGAPIQEIVVDKDTTLEDIPTPVKEGYEFKGWYFDTNFSETFDINTLLEKAPITLYAKWQVKQYTISFVTNNSEIVDAITKDYGATITLPTTLTKEGYLFDKWYEDSNFTKEFTASTMPSKDTTLYAKWLPKPVTITFDSMGGSTVNPITKNAFENVSAPAIPTLMGYEFKGWYTTSTYENEFVFNTMPTNNIKLYAKWQIKYFKITFVTNAEVSVTEIVETYNTKITPPNNPIRQGYEFIGWYKDENLTTPYVFDKMPAYDQTLYAKWRGLDFTITFDSMGGSSVSPITAAYQSSITKPNNPVYEGYSFGGWYKERECINPFTFDKMPLNGATVYAKWIANEYTITFDSMGGSAVPSLKAPYLSTISAPLPPTKEGYSFEGWYLESTYETLFIFDKMPLNGLTLYANWVNESDSQTIDFVLKDTTPYPVYVKGTIFALDGSEGFYIYDSTGQLYVSTTLSNFSLFDTVLIKGYMVFKDQRPLMSNVLSIEVLASGGLAAQPQTTQLSQINSLTNSTNYYHPYVTLSGIIGFIDDTYYLIDQNNPIYRLSFVHKHDASVSELVGSKVTMKLLLNRIYGEWYINSYEVVQIDVVDTEERIELVEKWINQFNNQEYYEDSYFAICNDPYEYAIITFNATGNNQALYDENNRKFRLTQDRKNVQFEVNAMIGQSNHQYSITVFVNPVEYDSIIDYINGSTGQQFTLRGVVVSSNFEYGCVLKDDTGSVYLRDASLHVGDEVVIQVIKYYEGYIYFTDAGNYLIKLISINNDLNLEPIKLSVPDYVTLVNKSEYHLGDYVELTGYIRALRYNDYYSDYYIYIENSGYSVLVTGYMVKLLVPYDGMEVTIRGFIDEYWNGDYYFYFAGARNDIIIRNYTDQELVDILSKMFIHKYANKTFQPLDEFYLDPYHPILGGEISYVFSESSKQYYDETTNTFKIVYTPQPITIDITFKSGTSSVTYRYNTTLEPFTYDTIDELVLLDDEYKEVIVKGIIVYWHPEYSILKVEDKYLFINIDYLNTYLGDEVILKGSLYNYNGELYITSDNRNSILQTISRNNPITLNYEQLSLLEVSKINMRNPENYNRYIQTQGILTFENNNYYLHLNDNYVLILPVDVYVMNRLNQYLNQLVTLRGFAAKESYYTGSIALRFNGNLSEIASANLTNQNKVDLVKGDIINTFDRIQLAGGSAFKIPARDTQFNTNISYQVINTGLYDTVTCLTYPVTSLTEMKVHVVITLNQATSEFDIIVELTPTGNNVTIKEWITSPNTVKSLTATIISLSYDYALLQDETGLLYMQILSDDYYNLSIGQKIKVTGKLVYSQGSFKIQAPNRIEIISSYNQFNVSFSDISLSALSELSLNYIDNYGKAVQIRGKLGIDYYGYYVSDGQYKIRLQYDYNTLYYLLYGNEGLNVTVRGFIFNESGEEWSVLFNRYQYEGINSLIKGEVTAEIAKQIVKQNIDSYIGKTPYYAYEYVDLPYYINNFNISYSIIEGAELVEFYGYEFKAPILSNDTVIKIRATYSIENITDYYDFEIKIKGSPINNFEDLFINSPEMTDINLFGTVLHKSNVGNWCYLQIDGNVYYLANMDYYVDAEVGDTVFIKGKKSIIDGVPNYSYHVTANRVELDYDELETRTITIHDIINIDLNTDDIRRDFLKVYGTLGYDEHLEMFYLEDNGKIIYIRYDVSREIPTFTKSYGYGGVTYKTLLDLIGEYIGMNVYYPDARIRGNYVLVDFAGRFEDLDLPYMTDQEHLDHAVQDYINKFDVPTLYSGDYFYQYLVKWYDYHEVEFDYDVKNEADRIYFDEYVEQVNIINEARTITFIITATKFTDGQDNLTRTFEVEVTISPIETTDVKEVVLGKNNKKYMIEGIVTACYPGNWMYVEDETGIIYVRIYTDSDDYGNEIKIGDKVLALGYRQYDQITPILSSINVKVLSSNNSFTKVATPITVEDLINIDYLNPLIYGKYISVTGTLVKTGNYYYPNYEVHQDGYNTPFIFDLQESNEDYKAMINEYVGDVVTVEGYLNEFWSYYATFPWYIIYNSHTVIINN